MAANWHYAKGGEKHGPITSAQLKEMAAEGQLSPDDLVWREDMKEWRKASTLKGLFPDDGPSTDVVSTPEQTAAVPNGEGASPKLWQKPPIIVLLIVCCFPLGLFLLWKYTEMAVQRKALWSGVGLGAILLLFAFNQVMTQRANSNLTEAEKLWNQDDRQAAADIYVSVISNRASYLTDEQREVVFGRAIDHLASKDDREGVSKIVDRIDLYYAELSPAIETEVGRQYLRDIRKQKVAEERAKSVGSTDWHPRNEEERRMLEHYRMTDQLQNLKENPDLFYGRE
ncbi:MAG: DUF4339 domain-containing protein [Planctomycetaceae bacterium]